MGVQKIFFRGVADAKFQKILDLQEAAPTLLMSTVYCHGSLVRPPWL